MTKTFLNQGSNPRNYQNSKFVVIPVPYEATTTYGKGTKKGPAAIILASAALETFDEELLFDVVKKTGIYTTRPCLAKNIRSSVARVLSDKKVPVILGGEHSISAFALPALAAKFRDLSVLQLDAHADLRDRYFGSKKNHGCVMARILELCPAVQVGIRSLSGGEYKFAQQTGQVKKIHWAAKPLAVNKIVNQLSKDVYITIDVDVFDPSLVPATGTPEPGGLGWYQVLGLLKKVGRQKNVVGFDVTELSPRSNNIASDFTVAKLVYKLIGYCG